MKIDIVLDSRPVALARHRHTRSGHVYNPSLQEMKDTHSRSLPFAPSQPLRNSLSLYCWFIFKRPANHYRSGKYSHLLKDNAPYYHDKKPDLSNLIKFYEDALGLSTKFFIDDKQICHIDATKVYGIKDQVRLCLIEVGGERI